MQGPKSVSIARAHPYHYIRAYHGFSGIGALKAHMNTLLKRAMPLPSRGRRRQGKLPNVYAPGGGKSGFTGAFFGIRGNGLVFFDWLQWIESPDLPTLYPDPNHVGIARCAIEVDDLDSAHEILKRSRWAQEYPILMGGIEEWDFGPQWGVRRVLNFKDPEGVAFQLVERPASRLGALHPYGRAPSSAEPRASSCANLNIKVRVFAGRSTELRSAHVAKSLFSVTEHHRQGIHFIHRKAQFARAKMSKRSLSGLSVQSG